MKMGYFNSENIEKCGNDENFVLNTNRTNHTKETRGQVPVS